MQKKAPHMRVRAPGSWIGEGGAEEREGGGGREGGEGGGGGEGEEGGTK
jgi:hypothetical protein